jgi:pimeloyl-ACP methyl ester carboxylesterase
MGRRVWFTLLPLAVLAGACSAGPGGGGGASSSGPASSGSPSSATTSSEVEAGSVAGQWQGQLEIPGAPLSVGVTVTHTDGGYGGTFEVPAQGLSGAALTDVAVDGATIGFAIAGIPGNPTYRGQFDGQRIAGTFSQSGQSFPLTLSRGTPAAPARPQEPQPPHPYRSTDVSYPGGVTIAGTLTEPDGDGPFPAVLLITGSGAQDRDETIAGHRPFLLLADTLTRAGYAVLRVDDRGVGGTGGTQAEATYDDLAGDAAAGLQFLRARPDIRADAVGLLGHSEGGYLAPLVAQTQAQKPDFVILMAGPAVSGRDVLIEQNKLIMAAAGATRQQTGDQVAFVTRYADLIIAGDFAGATELARQQVAKAGGDANLAPDTANENMRSLLTYDPAAALSALTVPVLAVYGGRDLQVPPAQSEPVLRSLLAANPDATVQTFPTLNHLMQPAGTGSPSEYATTETTIDPTVLDLYVSWLQQRFPPA